jgi:beta-lactamase regulating signal transducer with metallopeptidase domain
MTLLFIEAAVKSSCLLGVAALATQQFGRRTSAASRHLIWTFAVAGLLLLPILSSVLPRWDVAIPGMFSSASVAAPTDEPIGRTDVRNFAPGDGTRAGLPTAAAGAAGAAVAPGTSIGSRVSSSLASMLPVVYSAGVLLLLIRLVSERWIVGRLARRAVDVSDPAWTRLLAECALRMDVRRPVRLLRSLERSMPMAFGSWRPCILIPSVADTWSDDRRRAVLLHELAHIARHDCVTQLMAAVACAIYWIHPGAWWVARRLRTERELACDDRVLSAGTNDREYARHLLELAYTLGGYRAPALVVSMARPRQVEGRMIAVLDAARNRAVPAWRGQLAGAAIAAALLVPIATAQAMAVSAKAPAGDTVRKPNAEQTREVAEATAITEKGLGGTWEIRTTQTAPVVYLRLSESASSSHGSMIAIERLEGLAPARLSGAGGAATFVIRRDAGVLTFEGTVHSGVGAGTYTFTPSASFPAELAKRGFARPTPADQYMLARGDIGFAFLDELTTQRYTRPDLSMLVRAAHHGVDLTFVREMGGLGYRLGNIDALMAQRDHGVSPQYIRELGAQGLPRLTADDLIRARDHGVSPQYVGELKALGYASLSLDGLVGARDHGVSPEYVRDLTALGYQRVPLDALIAARDHGISPEYVRELRDVGYRLTLEELTKARDHGVSAEDVRQLKTQGRNGLTLDELVELRDKGAMPQYVEKRLKTGSLFDIVMDYHNRMFRAFHRWLRQG